MLFGFFNVLLFVMFIFGMFWKCLILYVGWLGLVVGMLSVVMVWVMSLVGVFILLG